MRIGAVIPALDEEETIGPVVIGVRDRSIDPVVVVDNGSTDQTAMRARGAGAVVVSESARGYGAACQAGIAALPHDVEVVLFLDADGSDDPGDIESVLRPVVSGVADLSIGNRLAGGADAGALSAAQRFGNRLAGILLGVLYGAPRRHVVERVQVSSM